MTTIQRYPSLDILPAETICLHEHHDPQRTLPLLERIKSSRILYNPPVVIPSGDAGSKFMVLDGANRVTAMKEMGLPHLLVQIVDAKSPGLSLQTWNHVIWNIEQEGLLREIASIKDILLEYNNQPTFTPHSIGLLELPDHRRFSLGTASPSMRSEVITRLVRMYSNIARFDRTMIEEIEGVDGYYEKLAGLIIYPQFKISEVIRFCQEENLLPAGITRFIVSPRALRVNYPLDKLANNRQSIEDKRHDLHRYIQDRMEKKGVRIYTETTVLYDE
jgi:hypothetical protein